MRGIVIYDFFPREDFSLEGKDFKFSVTNNAPFSLPFVNLPFVVGLEISNNTGPVECMMWSAIGFVSCKGNSLDLGYIPVGKSGEISFRITPKRCSFTITARAYANFWGTTILSAAKSVRIVFVRLIAQTQELYRVEKIW